MPKPPATSFDPGRVVLDFPGTGPRDDNGVPILPSQWRFEDVLEAGQTGDLATAERLQRDMKDLLFELVVEHAGDLTLGELSEALQAAFTAVRGRRDGGKNGGSQKAKQATKDDEIARRLAAQYHSSDEIEEGLVQFIARKMDHSEKTVRNRLKKRLAISTSRGK